MATPDTWEQYRQAKVAWVNDHTGGSVFQIIAVVNTTLVSYGVWLFASGQSPAPPAANWRTCLYEWMLLVLPVMLACSVMADRLSILHTSLVCIGVGLFTFSARAEIKRMPSFDIGGDNPPPAPSPASTPKALNSTAGNEHSSPRSFTDYSNVYAENAFVESAQDEAEESIGTDFLELNGGEFPTPTTRISFEDTDTPRAEVQPTFFSLYRPPRETISILSAYRAFMMILTVFCILAVDFPVFPRAFAKCETWGTSLMDLGVGSFVFSHGTVSLRRGFALPRRVRHLLRRIAPLLTLGLLRTAFVKRTEYPEHVSEYGVHWNFFLTLAFVLPSLELSQLARARAPFAEMAFGVSALYEVALRATNLQVWAISTERHPGSLLSLNKEGIASLPGYFAIALIGLDHAQLFRDDFYIERGLARRAVFWWSAYLICDGLEMHASRRLANLPYVLWTAGFNSLMLLSFFSVRELYRRVTDRLALDSDSADEEHAEDATSPRLLEIVNRHSLAVFLSSNLLTGLINLTFRTIYCSTATSTLLLTLYMLMTLLLLPLCAEHFSASTYFTK